MSETWASASSRIPDIEKQIKAQLAVGQVPSSVSRCLEPVIKHEIEARVLPFLLKQERS